ncbi:hypothetical protein [Methanoregula sp.]|uniref:hypothetical protein n=1 Tax=Methanoregula sp. TaxID=2052170 RepID=UPI003568311D
MRPAIQGERGNGETGPGRQPWEYDPELAKYNAIAEFIKMSGDLSDTTDLFHGYEAQWIALNKVTGYDCSLRLKMYREFRRTSPDHLRMARNEIVRLLSQPKMIVHGNDLIRDDVEEPGFWSNVANGAKKLLGMKPAEQPRPEAQTNGRY